MAPGVASSLIGFDYIASMRRYASDKRANHDLSTYSLRNFMLTGRRKAENDTRLSNLG
jgi:hypothetical protein